jgi:hypothetical protein
MTTVEAPANQAPSHEIPPQYPPRLEYVGNVPRNQRPLPGNPDANGNLVLFTHDLILDVGYTPTVEALKAAGEDYNAAVRVATRDPAWLGRAGNAMSPDGRALSLNLELIRRQIDPNRWTFNDQRQKVHEVIQGAQFFTELAAAIVDPETEKMLNNWVESYIYRNLRRDNTNASLSDAQKLQIIKQVDAARAELSQGLEQSQPGQLAGLLSPPSTVLPVRARQVPGGPQIISRPVPFSSGNSPVVAPLASAVSGALLPNRPAPVQEQALQDISPKVQRMMEEYSALQTKYDTSGRLSGREHSKRAHLFADIIAMRDKQGTTTALNEALAARFPAYYQQEAGYRGTTPRPGLPVYGTSIPRGRRSQPAQTQTATPPKNGNTTPGRSVEIPSQSAVPETPAARRVSPGTRVGKMAMGVLGGAAYANLAATLPVPPAEVSHRAPDATHADDERELLSRPVRSQSSETIPAAEVNPSNESGSRTPGRARRVGSAALGGLKGLLNRRRSRSGSDVAAVQSPVPAAQPAEQSSRIVPPPSTVVPAQGSTAPGEILREDPESARRRALAFLDE